ncbi:MAG: nicotinate-nucleotide adenylyltransferase [Alphaproteobacteria bacterium]|nr:nicotinate-nucleotide adenylyltransferase [Alphaproteobacteria bacterium]
MDTVYDLAARTADRKVGILGGSFNPAHRGHLHISRLALHRLDLDQIWWMVSPQNPLKPPDATAPMAVRMAEAWAVAGSDRRIVVTDIEAHLGTRFTADTLTVMRLRMPRIRFVWLMGADNLIQLPDWHHWETVMATVPVAVLARPTYSLRAMVGKVAQRYADYRLRPEASHYLADRFPPAWTFIAGPMHAASATAIRAARRDEDDNQRRRQS